MKTAQIAFLFLVIAISSCKLTQFGEQGLVTQRQETCSYNYGYAHGVNSAKRNEDMVADLDVQGLCTADEKEILMKGYHEGYTALFGCGRTNTQWAPVSPKSPKAQ